MKATVEIDKKVLDATVKKEMLSDKRKIQKLETKIVALNRSIADRDQDIARAKEMLALMQNLFCALKYDFDMDDGNDRC